MSQLQKVDVIIFVGPSLSGRTLYYYQELAGSHVRISAAELYRSDPRANLRIIIQKIVAELKKGHKVVIDDGNIQRQTRLSYVSGISKKVPGCSFGCVQFAPENGGPQLELCREWSLAQWVWYNILLLSKEGQPVLPIPAVFEGPLGADPSEKQDVSLDWDKFDVISTIVTPLVCPSSHQLTSPLLLVQWEGMLERTDRRCFIKKGVFSAFQKWSSANPAGHIVVVQDGRQSNAEAVVMRAEMMEMLVPIVDEHPFYFIITKSEFNASVQCSHSELLAFIQYLFTASLRHKSSLYIHHSKLDQTRAEEMGMRTAPASKVFHRPHTVTTVHYTEQESSTLLQKTAYTDHKQSIVFKNGLSLPELSAAFQDVSFEMRSLPLYSLARLLEQAPSESTSVHATCKPDVLEYSLEFRKGFSGSVKHVSAETAVGVTLGLLYRDLGSLERFQEQYQKSLKTVTEMKVGFRSSGSGSSPQQESLTDSYDQNNLRTSGQFQFPLLKPQAILEHAVDSGAYARGLEYQEHVCAIREEGKGRLIGKVQSHDGKGTSGVPYVVSAHISRNGSITGSHCNCKAGMREGRCKHVVALLLVHFKNQTAEVGAEEPVAHIPEEDSVGRSLPRWIQESSQESIASEVSIVKDATVQKQQKRRKRKSGDSDSYKLSEADLLDTAMEVIELCKTQHKRLTHSENGTEFKAGPDTLERSLLSVSYLHSTTDCQMNPVEDFQRQSIISGVGEQPNLLSVSFTGSLLSEKQDLCIVPLQSSLESPCIKSVQETMPSAIEQVNFSSEDVISPSERPPKSVDSAYVSNTVREEVHNAKDYTSLLDELFM